MAEPIIVSYARGLLREFPGIPEGVVDVIPVDMVVAAIIAVAADGPDPDGPTVYQVASSVRNPLRYGELVDLVRSWFLEHPLYDADGQPIMVPEWSFPGAAGSSASCSGPRRRCRWPSGSSAPCPCGASAPSWRHGWRSGAPRRAGARLRRAVRGLRRDRGPLPRGPSRWRCGSGCRPADRDAFCFDPARHLVAGVRARRPPAVGGGALPGPVVTPALHRREPARPGPARHLVPRAPPGRLRPREHARGLQRGGVLRLAGGAPPPRGRAGPAHGPHPARGTVAARPRPPRPRRLPAHLLPALRGCARRPAAPGRRRRCSTTCFWPSPSPPASPGCGRTGPSGTAPCSSPAPSTSWSSPCARCSTRWCAPGWERTTPGASRDASTASPHRRGAGPRAGRLRRAGGTRPR